MWGTKYVDLSELLQYLLLHLHRNLEMLLRNLSFTTTMTPLRFPKRLCILRLYMFPRFISKLFLWDFYPWYRHFRISSTVFVTGCINSLQSFFLFRLRKSFFSNKELSVFLCLPLIGSYSFNSSDTELSYQRESPTVWRRESLLSEPCNLGITYNLY